MRAPSGYHFVAVDMEAPEHTCEHRHWTLYEAVRCARSHERRQRMAAAYQGRKRVAANWLAVRVEYERQIIAAVR